VIGAWGSARKVARWGGEGAVGSFGGLALLIEVIGRGYQCYESIVKELYIRV
jgi:hypothetical protein